MQSYLRAETLPPLRAVGKGQLQEVSGSPEVSGTPTPLSGAGTAAAGTWSPTFSSQSFIPRVCN